MGITFSAFFSYLISLCSIYLTYSCFSMLNISILWHVFIAKQIPMEIEEMCSKLTLSCDVARPVVYRDMTICTGKWHARNFNVGNLRYGKRLQAGLLAAGHSALDETVRAGLRRVHLGVLASVLETLVPAEIYKRAKCQYIVLFARKKKRTGK